MVNELIDCLILLSQNGVNRMKLRRTTTFFLGLALLGCGYIALDLSNGYRLRRAFTAELIEVRPSLSPTQALQWFWQLSSVNQISNAKLFVGRVPASFWMRCKDDPPPSNLELFETSKDPDFFGMPEGLTSYTAMLRANRPGLRGLRIIEERIFEDEAVVDFEYLNAGTTAKRNRAFLKRDFNGWQLFEINFTDHEWMKVDEYARERVECPKIENNFNGYLLDVGSKPNLAPRLSEFSDSEVEVFPRVSSRDLSPNPRLPFRYDGK